MMNKRASYELLELVRETVTLKFHVNLTTKDKNGADVPNAFHSIYENTQGRYISIRVFSYLTLEIKDRTQPWDRTKSIMITPRNMYQFKTAIDKIIASIYKTDCFYLDTQGETKLNLDKLEEYTIRAYNLTMDQRMIIEPSLVYDYQEDSYYEGANFFINNMDNVFSIPIDVIESLKYVLDKFDFMLYTQAMLNYYFQRVWKEEDDVEQEVVPVVRKPHVFAVENKTENIKEVENEVTGSSVIIKEDSKEDVFDL